MHITLLTAATRADTAPLAALALGLRRAGHRVRLAANRGFAASARAYDLDFFALDANPFDRAAPALALEQLQAEAWQACQGTDAVIYDPFSLLGGYFLARQMGVPAVAAALAPLDPTGAHPAWPLYFGPRLGAAYNRLTHTFVRQAAWQTVRAPVEKFWRQRAGAPVAGLGGPYAQQRAEAFPVLYGYSGEVLPRPADWPDHLHVTGYWFLEPPAAWRPPPALLDFLQAGPPPVYVGVGGAAASVALEAVRRAGQRAVLDAPDDDHAARLALPATVLRIDRVPPGWLFPRLAALIHAGGAATTAAGLRAGVPAVVIPARRRASAWGRLLEAQGLGPPSLPVAALTPARLDEALRTVLTDRGLRHRVAAVGDRLEAEEGVARAVAVVEAAVG